MNEQQSCSTCQHWQRMIFRYKTMGDCLLPDPTGLPSSWEKWPTLETEGDDCPAWVAKKNVGE